MRLLSLHVEEKGQHTHTLQLKQLDRRQLELFERELLGWIQRTAVPRMRAVTYPLVVATGASGVRSAAAQIGISFRVLQPGLLDYASTETTFLAGAMGETLGARVASVVQQSLGLGETIQGLKDRLMEDLAFSAERAQLVARTETTRAWNGAQRRSLDRYQSDTGTQIIKTWLSARDDRVREEHIEMDGEQRPIDEEFSNGLMEPGEPNCRCTLIYSVVGSAIEEEEE